jgi:quercetin dioxygenase-like cupin family protein
LLSNFKTVIFAKTFCLKVRIVMPVFKYSEIKLEDVRMDGVAEVARANVIGPDQGWKDYTLRVFRVGPNGFSPHHQHDWEHINYVIKGKGTLTIGEQTFELAQGDFAFVPPNSKHQFKNPYDGEFEFICIVPNRGAY